MARAVERLSALTAKKANAPGLHADGNGLYLRVGPAGSKSWILRYRHDGRRHDIGLGPYPLISLADARQRANERRRLLIDGIDPLGQKRTARIEAAKTMPFKTCAQAYFDAHSSGWRSPKHAVQWRQSMTDYMLPVLGDVPVQAVDVGLVLKAIEPLWRAKPETASRVRQRIEGVLDWATARGYRSGDNPARWRGHLENLLPATRKVRRIEHHAALPYSEISAFVAELRRDTSMAARALEFTILTAARAGEVIGARWEEINAAERLWTVPADRMKAGREHRVPLSEAAMAILAKLAEKRSGEFIFPGAKAGRPVGDSTLFDLLKRLNRDTTTHGFRSTFRDWAAERTAFPSEVAEMALAHVVGDKTEAAYRRGDLFAKRRQIMDAWAQFCAGIEEGENVVDLRRFATSAA